MESPEPTNDWVPTKNEVVSRVTKELRAELDDRTFAGRLKILRLAMGLSVPQMATLCGTDDATWSTWEKGAQPRGLDDLVRRISERTHCSATWLMWRRMPWFNQPELFPVPMQPGQMKLPHRSPPLSSVSSEVPPSEAASFVQ